MFEIGQGDETVSLLPCWNDLSTGVATTKNRVRHEVMLNSMKTKRRIREGKTEVRGLPHGEVRRTRLGKE